MSITRIQIPETVVAGKPLGRHIVHDPASLAYPAQAAPGIVSVSHASIGLPLDQGQIGSCTANALVGVLNTQPNVPAHGPWTERGAVRLYKRETALEGEPYPPNDPGGSGLEVCQAALSAGWIQSYAHAFGIEHALSALVLGPVITGVDWYDSFDDCDPATGIIAITPGASVRGGHEFVVVEIDAANELVWAWQSWGLGVYGLNLSGRFAMSFDTWAALLDQQGDVTVPTV